MGSSSPTGRSGTCRFAAATAVGSSGGTLGPGVFDFGSQPQGHVYRRFDQVLAGDLVCYAHLHGLDGIVLVQLDGDRLSLERQSASDCQAGYWHMTDARVTFER
ncbi:MAG: hypothetical protein EXR75_13955 [Myxococcales bacterium]|nr:hypothetical protein [Myxococcales bacterium]